jgi:putative Ca2+/H+ antiporter (TMEM165/GDT1 family)
MADMDLKTLASTFGLIFVAELGDKTQLATLSVASAGGSRWAIFAGAALALVTSSALAVVLGESFARVFPPSLLRRIAGAAFVVMGVLFIVRR